MSLSIHDLTRRSTQNIRPRICRRILSIHDLTRRSTMYSGILILVFKSFNSRPHEEVDSIRIHIELTLIIFQFTTSRGGRLIGSLEKKFGGKLSIHDLTRRSTDKPLLVPPRIQLSIHDLTRRSTIVPFHSVPAAPSFNSRPHEEVDNNTDEHGNHEVHLSIHDLTRRSTYPRKKEKANAYLSIHDLTRRSTLFFSQLTTSC